MAIRFEEKFWIDAAKEQVWSFLSDPPRVATCLPGAELTAVVDEQTYKGRVQVKVGPIVAKYRGQAVIEVMDAEAGRLEMTTRANQVGAVGRVEGQVRCTIQALDVEKSQVEVVAELNVTGRMAQLGGGMIQTVGKQIFREFAECVRQTVMVEKAAATSSPFEPEGEATAEITGGRPVPAGPARPVNAFSLVFKAVWGGILNLIAGILRSTLNVIERWQKAL